MSTISNKRRKAGITPIANHAELESIVSEIAGLMRSEQSELIKLNEAIANAKELAKSLIEEIRKNIAAKTKRVEAWALAHREEFNGKKSMTVRGHELRFRSNGGKIKLDNDEETIILALEDLGDQWSERFVRIEPVFNTAAANAALSSDDPADEDAKQILTSLGVHLIVKENFAFIPDFELAKDIKS